MYPLPPMSLFVINFGYLSLYPGDIIFEWPLMIWFQLFVKAVAKSSGFTFEKGFKAIQNIPQKYVVFFQFLFG